MGDWFSFRHRGGRFAQTETALGLVVLFAVVVLLGLVAAVAIGFRNSQNLANDLDQRAEQRRVLNYVDRMAANSIAKQKVQLTWDDAFRAVSVGRDMRWADAYLGQFLWTNLDFDRIYLVDADGHLLRAWQRGRPGAGEDFAAVAGAVRQELLRMESNRQVYGIRAGVRRLADTDWPIDAQGRALTRWGKTLVRLGDRPALVTVVSIVPDTDMSLLRARPGNLVSVRIFDDPLLRIMQSDLLLDHVAPGRAANGSAAVNEVALAGPSGEPVAWLNWRRSPYGQAIAEHLRPIFIALVGFVLALIATGAAILKILGGTLAKLAEREALALDLSRRDAMTALPNRGYFIHRLERRLAGLSGEPGMGLAVAFFDLDNFKYINDTLGHAAGDQLISEVAVRARHRLPSGDIVGRLGGDEFVVMRVAPNVPGEVSKLGRELMGIFAAPFRVDGQLIDVTASCGISWAPQQGSTSAELLRNADIAMFRAKQRGRARWRAFNEEMAHKVHRRSEIESELRRALQQDQLSIAYQPIVAADDGRIIGCEALLRWDHPELGQVSPSVFVPIAEQAGLMNLLGWWTLEEVLRQRAAAWPDLDVSINLSPIQLTARGFLEDVDRLMLDFGARPQGITFEVTEGALMERQGGAFEVLAGLRARGFGIALDDFGTGYSSLSYLTSFHFDRLKIDRAFVRNIDCDLDAQAVLKAIVELGHTLQTRVVAEGVETLLQRQLVVAAGCDMIQGFYHWRPLVPENLADLLMQKRRGPGGVAVAEAADALADRAA